MLGYYIGANLPNPAEELVLDGCSMFLLIFQMKTNIRIVNSKVDLTREGFGTYNVKGTIDGKYVCYEAKGFMEYAAASPYDI